MSSCPGVVSGTPMKVVILCGGLGTRLREETEHRPKPMVPVGGRPILWHIMRRYAAYGFHEFVLCLGYKGEMIKDYFLHYRTRTSDFTLRLGHDGPEAIAYHNDAYDKDWRVTLISTGEHAMTGARMARVRRYVEGAPFMLTYGDGVADLDIAALARFHAAHGKLATVTTVRPGVSRFGELELEGERIAQFREKPDAREGHISGGFFVFQPEVFDYVRDADDCVLEREALQQLALDGQLMGFRHEGYWQCMDTYRDYQQLNEIWDRGDAPWMQGMPSAAAAGSRGRRVRAPRAGATASR